MENIAIIGLGICTAIRLFDWLRNKAGIIDGTLWAINYIAVAYGFPLFSVLLIVSQFVG